MAHIEYHIMTIKTHGYFLNFFKKYIDLLKFMLKIYYSLFQNIV